MATYNLNTLLHRTYDKKYILDDGEVIERRVKREMPVRIPRIQRDYAEGRNVESIERKRRNLLNDMLDVIYNIKENLSFDFVYGYIKNSKGDVVVDNSWQNDPNSVFEPLDGQQRLTTLFLLHWLFGRDKSISIGVENKKSLFIYETRDTSEEFCHWLVGQNAQDIITRWEKEVKIASATNKKNQEKWKTEKNDRGNVDQIANRLRFPLVPVPSLFDYMQSIETFKWDWHDDPNIHSMITVLETAVDLINERGLSYQTGIANNSNLNNIDFMLLDNLNCDGEQLFEKMNARGKPLTSFEVLKSSLEEEMERQYLPLSNLTLTQDWRTAIDGKWIDFCWDNSNVGQNPELSSVKDVETKLERLITRMAEKSFYRTDIQRKQQTQSEALDYAYLLKQAVEGSQEGKDKIMDRYFDYARSMRAANVTNLSQLDFGVIYQDIENLLYKDSDGKWKDASTLIPQLNRDNSNTLLLEFLESTTHSIRVMMYAMLAYLRIVPAATLAQNAQELANFRDWMRFIRNVYNANNKTARLDNFGDVRNAIKAVDEWLERYKTKYTQRNPQDILRLIHTDIPEMPGGQEQARIEEETFKAGLRLYGSGDASASDWEMSILKAEDNYYLWGQIIAPLKWSAHGDTYDKQEFDEYIGLFNRLFDHQTRQGSTIDALLVQTMLCYEDYRLNSKEDQNKTGSLGSLGILNDDRDHSWKRYLRDAVSGVYAPLFKKLLEQWRTNKSFSIEELLSQEIAANKGGISISDWRYFIVNINNPENLVKLFGHTRTSGRYVYSTASGQAYIFKSNTFRTANRFELLTCYLAYEPSVLAEGVSVGEPAHTSDPDGAHVDFTLPGGNQIRLTAKENGLYDISQLSGYPILPHTLTGKSLKDVESELKTLNVIHHL